MVYAEHLGFVDLALSGPSGMKLRPPFPLRFVDLGPRVAFVAVVREPLDWLLSHFFFKMGAPPPEGLAWRFAEGGAGGARADLARAVRLARARARVVGGDDEADRTRDGGDDDDARAARAYLSFFSELGGAQTRYLCGHADRACAAARARRRGARARKRISSSDTRPSACSSSSSSRSPSSSARCASSRGVGAAASASAGLVSPLAGDARRRARRGAPDRGSAGGRARELERLTDDLRAALGGARAAARARARDVGSDVACAR